MIPPTRILDQRGYILRKSELSEEVLDTLRKYSQIRKKEMAAYSKGVPIYAVAYLETRSYLILPRFRGVEIYGEPSENRLSRKLPRTRMKYLTELRPNQIQAAQNTIAGLGEFGGGMLHAGCGFGKTNLALYIACHFQLKVLFLAHTEFLMEQFEDRALKFTSVKRVGRIQGKKFDLDAKIVVGSLKTLCSDKYTFRTFREFGMVIIDEAHHMAADTFQQVFRKVGARYMLGITADTERSDGTFPIVNWNLGRTLHQEPIRVMENVLVKKLCYLSSDPIIKEVPLLPRKRGIPEDPNYSKLSTDICESITRTRFIVRMVRELARMGRNILILTDRRDNAFEIKEMLEKRSLTRGLVGMCIGQMKQVDRIYSIGKQIMIGTTALAKEGLDIEELDTLIFCSSCSKPAQPAGRVLRREHYDEPPIVIDIVDIENEVLRKRYRSRAKCYQAHKYTIQEYTFQDPDVSRRDRIKDALSTQSRSQIAAMLRDYSNPNDAVEPEESSTSYDPYEEI